ncbi:MAG: hypothetical protein SGBAC_000837 [Bacillariaceae sp.]
MTRNYVDSTTRSDIFLQNNGSDPQTHNSGNRRYERILASCMKEYTSSPNRSDFRFGLFFKLQDLDPPMRFLLYDKEVGQFYAADKVQATKRMRFAFHSAEKKLKTRNGRQKISFTYVDKVTASDILISAKGLESKSHPGSQLLRRELEPKLKVYQSAADQLEVCSKLFWELKKQNPAIRFLRRSDEKGKYYLCNEEYSVYRIQMVFDAMAIADWPPNHPLKTDTMDCNDHHQNANPNQTKCPAPKADLAPSEAQGSIKLHSKPTNMPPGFATLLAVEKRDSRPTRLCSLVKAEMETTESLQETQEQTPSLFPSTMASLLPTLPTQQHIQAAYGSPKQPLRPLLQVTDTLGPQPYADLSTANKVPDLWDVANSSQQLQVAIKVEDQDGVAIQHYHSLEDSRVGHEECDDFDEEEYMHMEAMNRAMVNALCGE